MASYHHLLLSLFFSLFSTTYSDINSDRAALLRLSAAVRGRTLRWNATSSTPCSWNGVTCNTIMNRVVKLRLPGYGLSGDLPLNSIGNLTQLRTLSLRHNSLSGVLPADIGSCTELRTLNLENNNFSGGIPATLFNMNNLVRVSLARNSFSGEISNRFNNLTMLKILRLEYNNFSGSLPDLNNLSQLDRFNVSFNRLTGSIPSSLNKFLPASFLSNAICGSAGPLGPCVNEGKSNKLSGGAITGIVIGSVVGLLLILVGVLLLVRNCRGKKSSGRVNMSPMSPMTHRLQPEHQLPTGESESQDLEEGFSSRGVEKGRSVRGKINDERTNGMVFFEGSFEIFSLEDLLKASAEVLGKGFIGSTYRAYLDRGGEVVVKRLKNVCVSEREFKAKVEELGAINHENLVPLRAYYYGREEKLIVFNAFPTNLSTALHGDKVSKEQLTWVIRSRIALGAATGIEYLHSLGPNVTHGNIKSSNILLSDYFDAHVSEFGITQLVSSTSNARMTAYCAPEVTDVRKISQQSDVYSFGVVLLELLTGKNPISAMIDEGIDLAKWARSVAVGRWTLKIFDPELIRFQNSEEQMVALLHLAISCTSRYPERRPPMDEVTKSVKEICR